MTSSCLAAAQHECAAAAAAAWRSSSPSDISSSLSLSPPAGHMHPTTAATRCLGLPVHVQDSMVDGAIVPIPRMLPKRAAPRRYRAQAHR